MKTQTSKPFSIILGVLCLASGGFGALYANEGIQEFENPFFRQALDSESVASPPADSEFIPEESSLRRVEVALRSRRHFERSSQPNRPFHVDGDAPLAVNSEETQSNTSDSTALTPSRALLSGGLGDADESPRIATLPRPLNPTAVTSNLRLGSPGPQVSPRSSNGSNVLKVYHYATERQPTVGRDEQARDVSLSRRSGVSLQPFRGEQFAVRVPNSVTPTAPVAKRIEQPDSPCKSQALQLIKRSAPTMLGAVCSNRSHLPRKVTVGCIPRAVPPVE